MNSDSLMIYSILLNLNVWYLNQIDSNCTAQPCGNIIDYVEKTKYLGYVFTNDKQDDVEMLTQLRLLYMRSNKIIRMFQFCTIDVKLELYRSFCTSFYYCYLWTGYKKNQLLTDCV